MQSPRVLAVVVTHNGSAWLGTCLRSLASQIYLNMDIVVVDSASVNDVAGEFARLVPNAEFVKVKRNVGYGAAANVALEISERAPSADYFLFVHDDIELEPESVSLMVATALETGAGIVGGKGLEWNHPERLVEVGMSADQFGYPYSGLEPGEIDQGQHDNQRETLFVTNACMFVSRSLIESCGLWDGAYFAFGEDLDLCIRGRLAGYKVMVQPGARYRHAEALTNEERAVNPVPSVRFLTRRNRLRTISKNASLLRLALTVPLYLALSGAEILVLLFLRKFEEIGDYPKALGSFVVSLPDILRRRRAVQKRRTIPDRKIRRLMVSDTDRARVFFEARLRAAERGTLELGHRTLSKLSPSSLKATIGRWVRRPSTLAGLAIVALLTLAMRNILVGGPLAAGSLLPFPEQTNRFMSEFLSGWRDVRLGTRSAAPAAFPVFWLFSLAGLGKAALAQKLMIVVLVGLGLFGVNRLIGKRTGPALARIIAVAVYSLSPVLGTVVSTGDIQALALYSALPYMLDLGFKILGASEPGQATKHVARLALLTAAVVALAPSALVAVTMLWVLASLAWLATASEPRLLFDRVGRLLATIPLALLVLVPWSLEAFRPRGPMLAPLFSGRTGTFFPLWSERKFEQMFFLDLQGGVAALVTAAIIAGVLILADPTRREQARVLIAIWAGFAFIGGLSAKGLILQPVATPQIWLMVPLVMAAILAGNLVAGIKEELPKHSFGWRHKIAMPAIGLALVGGLVGGWLPSLLDWERPPNTFAAGGGEQAASISSFLTSTADEVGDFRVLWLGKRWLDPIRAGSRRIDGAEYFLTGPTGLNMLDTQEGSPSNGEARLDQTVQSMASGGLHLGGHLLAPASIRFIIVDPRDATAMTALRTQRDIGLEQQQENVAIFRNLLWLPRAVLAPVNLVEPVAAKAKDDRALLLVKWSGGRAVPQRSPTSFVGDLPRTRHSQLLLGENFSSAWRATVGGVKLVHEEAFGWANRFELPRDARGQVRIVFTGRWVRLLWLLLEAGIVLVVAGSAWADRTEIRGRLK
ncbi:MAG: glycosyltransferase family 2 protein [Actinomycetota bacterium]